MIDFTKIVPVLGQVIEIWDGKAIRAIIDQVIIETIVNFLYDD